MNPETLPQWLGPDGTTFPNNHLYHEVRAENRIAYSLLWGEDWPKHADARAAFEEADEVTTVTLGTAFSTAAQFTEAKGFGAEKRGMHTLGKLARFVGVA